MNEANLLLLLQLTLLILSPVIAVWAWRALAERFRRGDPIVAYQPRHPVPWNGFDVAAVLAIYILLPSLIAQAVRGSTGRPKPDATVAANQDRHDNNLHPAFVLLRQKPTALSVAVCVFLAAILAPITEECLFRLILQGWLEKFERQLRRFLPWRQGRLRGLLPVLANAFLFALLHFRTETKPPGAAELLEQFLILILAWTVTLLLALLLLRLRAGATWEDLGLVPDRFWADVKLGMQVFLAIALMIYGSQIFWSVVFSTWFPQVAPDPMTLLPFAAVLGILYYRTHRIVPSIALHMALNATSLGMVWLL